MTAVWDSNVTFVCFLVLGASLVLPTLTCLWTLCNSMPYYLTWGKKKKRGSKEKKSNIKPSADFKPVQRVLLVFLDATERGGLGFAFLPSYSFERMETWSGS